ncbi:TMEM63C_3 [Blepharisma stoltei]|uniref:CSC1-like protein n=1 Tax=Blepharisma stoltei TaxID=1481888 RepID=A0AAU9JTF6_9CILI|nr:unnamed protein product [Blepharisma stoltei]
MIMHPGVYQLIYTVGADFLIFMIYFTLFLIYRKFGKRHIHSENPDLAIKNAVFSDSDTPFLEVVKHVWETSLQDIYSRCGIEAYMYIGLHIQIIIVLLTMIAIGATALIPIYFQGNGVSEDNLNREGIANVMNDSYSMVAPIVYSIVFSFLGYGLVYIVIKTVSNKAFPANIPIFSYAVELRGFNRDIAPEIIQPKLLEKFKKEFEDDVLGVYVVPNYTESYEAYLAINEAKGQLRKYSLKLEKSIQKGKMKRPMIRPRFFRSKVDAIEYYSGKVEKYQIIYENKLGEGKKGNTGYAYIMCRTPSAAENVKKHFKRNIDDLNSILWFAHTAPAPHEIKWENMTYNHILIRGKRILLLAFFMLLFFVWVTPAGFLKFFSDLISEFSVRSYFESVFNQYLPTLLLIFYQQVILYYSINYIVSHEKRTSLAMETVSRFEKYLIFMAFYVFILQAIGLQTIMQISIDGFWNKWRRDLPIAITQTGQFFTVFIIHQTFISNGLDLLRPVSVIMTKIKLSLPYSAEEKLLIQQASPFDFAYELASTLNSLLIILSYSVAYPIILIFGVLYFYTRYLIHKYLILCVYYVDKRSTGSKIPKACITSILFSIFIFQGVTGLIFMINEDLNIELIGTILIAFSLLIFVILLWKLPSILKKIHSWINHISRISEEREEPLLQFSEAVYMHPVEKIINGRNST